MSPRAAARNPYLGIDFGTTTSLVAWGRPVDDARGIEPVVLPVPQDRAGNTAESLPSLLYFPGGGKLVLGAPAREQLGLRPDRVVRRLKQLLGRFPRVAVAGRAYATVDLVAAVLRRLRRVAASALGGSPTEAVITVPASFDVNRRRALLDAAVAAGFKPHGHSLLDEPVAALGAWLHDRRGRRPVRGELDFPVARTVLMLDVGGGTSDSCVARIRPDGDDLAVELLALSRFTPVGGDDFDAAVARRLSDDFCARAGLDLATLPPGDRLRFEHRMILTAERAKRDLSAAGGAGAPPVARIRQMFLHGTHHLLETIDRARYAALVAPLLGDPRTRAADAPLGVLDAPWDALRKAGLEPGALDAVLLAGGMALVPAVQDAVAALLGRTPLVVPSPVTAIVAGAVVHHAARAGGQPGLRSAAPIAAESIGVQTAGGGFRRLIGAGTPLPARVVERSAFVLPDGWGRYVRIPIAAGEDGRPEHTRVLATLALRFPRRLAAGERVTLEATLDENKMLAVRGYLASDPSVAVETRLHAGEASGVDG